MLRTPKLRAFDERFAFAQRHPDQPDHPEVFGAPTSDRHGPLWHGLFFWQRFFRKSIRVAIK